MNDLDTIFRAFSEYKKTTSHDKESEDFRSAFVHNESEGDVLETMRTYPEIYEDWIEKIESEMVYVEKAVREERQFIRQDGEVVPIEKAKRVSRESVKHLARHSNNITHLPENPNDDIIPENIYIVENDSDYAVYENRFLYMLLCYTRDFITIRFNKILELGRTYKSNLTVNKNISFGKRTLEYSTVLNEVDTNSQSSPEFQKCRPLIKRIEDQQFLVVALLATPIMQEVAKSPMLRPPITLTNVLKKNNNFKHALDLYHYLASYTSQGYEIKEIRSRYSPLPDKLLDDCADVGLIQSFLSYQYGNRLTSALVQSMKEYERLQKETEEAEIRRRLDALRKQYSETGRGLEDYILLLEQHNRILDDSKRQLQIVAAEKEVLQAEKEKLAGEVTSLETQVAEKQTEINNMLEQHATELEELTEKHKTALTELAASNAKMVSELRESCEARVNDIKEKSAEAISAEKEISAKISDERDAAMAESDELRMQNGLLAARFTAMCQKHGEPFGDTDFTSEEGFTQLEREYEAFAKLFFEQWNKTKKRIRRELLYVLPERAKKVKAESEGKAEKPIFGKTEPKSGDASLSEPDIEKPIIDTENDSKED